VQNVVLAFLFNGLGVPAAVTGIVHPAMAMLAMAASVTTVLLNSFGGRLLPAARKSSRALEKTTIPVPSIHCEGCIQTIREALMKRGADTVTGDAAEKYVTVTYEKEWLDKEAIREEIIKAGFVV
ncbi:MAG: cation transporter, partial [Candidatus Tectomicrobia bacterium]|nr:cation transporter [Candidatus Tectomicrobia bacterium]